MMNSRKYSLFILLGLILTACGGGGGGGGGDTPPPPPPVTSDHSALTIDYSAVYPVINSNTASTFVIVRNNSSIAINGISYSSLNNANLIQNPSTCATIPANSLCQLSYQAQNLNISTQGSDSITATYNFQGHESSVSQIINFSKISAGNTADGIKISSSSGVITNFGNPYAYAIIYLYPTGNNTSYRIDSISVTQNGVTVPDAVVTHVIGSRVSSVTPVELKLPVPSTNQPVVLSVNVGSTTVTPQAQSLNAKSQTLKTQAVSPEFNYTSNLVLINQNGKAILNIGLIPILNAISGAASGYTTLYNAGSIDFIGPISVTPSFATTSSGYQGSCSATNRIAPNQTCLYTFIIDNSVSNGSLSVTYPSGSNTITESIPLAFYKGESTSIVQVGLSANPLTFTESSPGIENVTISNLSPQSISGIALIYNALNNAANITLLSNSCTGTLESNSTCGFSVQVANSGVSQGQLQFGITGTTPNGGSLINNIQQITFNAQPVTPNLVASFNHNISIQGDGSQSTTQTITITNDGTGTGFIESIYFSPSLVNATSNSATCQGQSLASHQSCSFNLIVGPALVESSAVIYTGQVVIKYYGGTIPQTNPATVSNTSLTYIILSQLLDLALDVTANGTSGNGTESTPFIYYGTQNNSGKQIKFTFLNTGGTSISVSGTVSNNVNPIAWATSGQSTCNTIVLAPGSHCDVIYNFMLPVNAPLAISTLATPILDISMDVPTLVFVNPSNGQFYNLQLPFHGGESVAISSHQGVIQNSYAINGESMAITTQMSSIPESGSYGSMIVSAKSSASSYLVPTGTEVCPVSTDGNTITQSCTLSGNVTQTLSNSYNLQNNAESQVISIQFTLPTLPAGTYIGMSPTVFNNVFNQ